MQPMQDEDITSNETDDAVPAKAPQLLEIELRILGALMEKQLTTPDGYPLTLNSIITACNQKSSREPISNYQQGEIARTLQELEDRNYIRKERGSRSDKFAQNFINQLGLGKKQQALLCVMMLRGPQTLSELNTRTQRMCEFVDKEDLELCVERLSERETPYTIRLGQQPGQRGERIGHLFAGVPTIYPSAPNRATNDATTASSGAATNVQNESVELLEMEVATLTEQVSVLSAETTHLKHQLEALYELTGHAQQDPEKR